MLRSILLAAAVAALAAGCSRPDPGASPGASASAPPAAASNEIFSAAPAPAAARNSGKVLQARNGGGYTYAEVQTASGQKLWIAGSQIAVQPGTEVQWGNFAVMRNFEAKSLGRSFAEILFVDRWGPAGQAAVATAPHGSFPEPQPGAATAGGTVRSVTHAGGYSYIEVDQGGGRTVWVAATETPMKQGDQVRWQGASEMSNFTARSLGRTFERILFAQAVTVSR